jgi:hypothetical protein
MATYVTLDYFSPIQRTREIDDEDYFGTFNEKSDAIDALQAGSSNSVEVDEPVLAGQKI